MMLDLPHTSAPMLMRVNTPPTTHSPPHQSRPAGNPPNRQPTTVIKEERGGRGPTSRRTPMRAASDCRPTQTVRHVPQTRSSTSHPPQQQDTVHRELLPGTGRGASAGAGPLRCTTRQAAGCDRAPSPPTTTLQSQPHTTRLLPTTTGQRKGESSCRQQQAPPLCYAAKMSPHRLWRTELVSSPRHRPTRRRASPAPLSA